MALQADSQDREEASVRQLQHPLQLQQPGGHNVHFQDVLHDPLSNEKILYDGPEAQKDVSINQGS